MTVGAVPSAPFPMPSHDPQPTLETLLERLGGLRSHYQPIVDLTTGRPVGFEALARFGAGVSPAVAFEQARAAGRPLQPEAAGPAGSSGAKGRPWGRRWRRAPRPPTRASPSTSAPPPSTSRRCSATCRATS